jgi:hypothetical protein
VIDNALGSSHLGQAAGFSLGVAAGLFAAIRNPAIRRSERGKVKAGPTRENAMAANVLRKLARD